MNSLSEVIRLRLAAQNIHSPPQVRSSSQRFEILKSSWWISSKYGLHSRAIDSARFPTKRLLREGAIAMPIGGTNRIFTVSLILKLYPIINNPIEENDLIEHMKQVGSADRQSISVSLNIPRRKLDYKIRRELKNWNIIKIEDIIWDTQTYFTSIHSKISMLDLDLMEEVIVDILERYPFLSIDQISLLSGIKVYDLSRPISNLISKTMIERGLTRTDSPDEYFSKRQRKNDEKDVQIDWTTCPIIVLDKYDPLVEIIKLERFFKYDDGDFWLFVEGIPQAEFKLVKSKNSRIYKVHSFRRLLESDKSLSDLLDAIKIWADTSNLQIKVDFADSLASQMAMQFVNMLKTRGYQVKENSMILRIDSQPSSSKDIEWYHMGHWYREQQYFRTKVDPKIIVQNLVQINDPISIGVRLNVTYQEINLNSLVYTTGINYQLGMIHLSHLPDIISGWPRDGQLNHLDRTILSKLNNSKSTKVLVDEINRSERDVIQRLRYLELNRFIRRDLSNLNDFLDISKSQWKLFNTDLPESLLSILPRKGAQRSFAAIGNITINLLQSHIPLTENQLSKYLGITIEQVSDMKNHLVRSGKIIEGYFIKGMDEVQLTTATTLDSIEAYHENLGNDTSEENKNQNEIPNETANTEVQIMIKEKDEEEYIPSSQRLDLIPSSDPLFQLHLSNLMLTDNLLIIKKRIPLNSKFYMVNWNGTPIGYVMLIPNTTGMFDYDMELKLKQSMVTYPIITATLEQVILINRNWFNDEIRLLSINDIKSSDSRYELLHFFLESIGLELI